VAVLFFDASENLFAHVINRNNGYHDVFQDTSKITTWMIPYGAQIDSLIAPQAFNPPLTCPVDEFVTNLPANLYLDINENITFSAYVRLKNTIEGQPGIQNNNFISVSFSNQSLVNFKVIQDEEIVTSQATKTRMRRQSFQIDTSGKLTEGKTDLRITANAANLGCTDTGLTSIFRISCPPGRFLEIMIGDLMNKLASTMHAPSPCTRMSNGQWSGSFEYTISSGKWVDPVTGAAGTQAKTATYNCTLYGPPIQAYYSDVFRPKFALFKQSAETESSTSLYDAEMKQEFEDNIILMELNGRNTYGFNATPTDMACRYRPQTWSEIRDTKTGIKTADDLFNAWTTSTYKACNETSRNTTSPGWQKDMYEILSSENGILWKGM
jgi:hypothetical protein